MATLLDLFDKVPVIESFAKVLENAEITDANLNVKSNKVSVRLKSKTLIDVDELFSFIDLAKNKYSLGECTVDVVY